MRELLVAAAASEGLEHAEVVITDVSTSGATLAVRGWMTSWPDVHRAEQRIRTAAAELFGAESSEAAV